MKISDISFRKLTKHQRIAGVILFFAYIFSLELGIRLYTAPTILTFASGIGLAGLVLGGVELWPLIYIASLAVYYMNGYPLTAVLITPVAYTVQSALGASLLRRWHFDPKLKRFQDMAKLMTVAFGIATIVPTFGYLAGILNHNFFGGPFPSLTWGNWLAGNVLSLLVVSPFLIRWIGKEEFKSTYKQKIELGLAFAMLLLVNFMLFWTTTTQLGNISLIYFALVPLMWIALRFGSKFTTLAMFITAIMAIAGSFFGSVIFAPDRLGIHLFQLEVLIEILTCIFFILAAVEDERKAVVNKLESHISQLEQAVGMRDEFISIASHELKTPVTTLKIYTQVIQKELQSNGQKTLVGQILKMDSQLNKLISLVEDLLNVSRTRMGKLEFHIEEFDMAELIKETVADVQSTSIAHEIHLEIDKLRPIKGDRDRIGQVIVNLLNNAIKYSPGASEIRVYAHDEGGRARIVVKDFGIGIDPKHHRRIFELFYRVHEHDTNTFPGFGIGLHISYEIIKRHDGMLMVKSNKGQGSEFSFILPYSPAQHTK